MKDFTEVKSLITMRLEYLRVNGPPTGDDADVATQARVKELKFVLDWLEKLEAESEVNDSAVTVYDIKLEIAKRIERISAFNPRDFDDAATTHNRGVTQGLDSLWKWIQNSEEA